LSERVYISVFGSPFLVALFKGFVNIRTGRVASHREWMIRAFAIGLSIATMRLIFIPALILARDPTDQQIATLTAVSFTAAFILHTALAEVWIRSTRKHNPLRAGAAQAL